MDRDDYFAASAFMAGIGVTCPHPLDAALLRGGIIGSVEIADTVTESDSPWFMGPLGLVLRDPVTCEFIPSSGLLGFYCWRRAGHGQLPPVVARWMKEVA